MFKTLLIGSLYTSTLIPLQQQIHLYKNISDIKSLRNLENEKYDYIFEDFFQSYFSKMHIASDLISFKKTKLYLDWKRNFNSFLLNLNTISSGDLDSIILNHENKFRYSDFYLKKISSIIMNLPSYKRSLIEKKLAKLPFLKFLLEDQWAKREGYKLIVKNLLDRKIPPSIRKEILELQSKLDWSNNWDGGFNLNNFVKNHNYDFDDLSKILEKYPMYKNQMQIQNIIDKIKRSNTDYSKIFEKYEDIFKNNRSTKDLENIINLLSNDIVQKTLEKTSIKKMSRVQKVLMISGASVSVIIASLILSLAIKIKVVKASKKIFILSASGSAILFSIGIGLLVLLVI